MSEATNAKDSEGGDAPDTSATIDVTDAVEVLKGKDGKPPQSIPPPRPKSVAIPRAKSIPPPRPDTPPQRSHAAPPRSEHGAPPSRPKSLRPPAPPSPPMARSMKPVPPPPPPPRAPGAEDTPVPPPVEVSAVPEPPVVAPEPAKQHTPEPPPVVAEPSSPQPPPVAPAHTLSQQATSEVPTQVVAEAAEEVAKRLSAAKAPERKESAKAFMEALERELQRSPTGPRAARLHYEIARQAECPLFDLELAAHHYKAASALNPEHLPTVRGARRSLLAKGQAGAALRYFDDEAKLVRSPIEKAMLLYEKGMLLDGALNQPGPARVAFAEARKLAPADPSILRGCLVAESKAGDWDAVVQILAALADVANDSPAERAALLAAQAQATLIHKRQKDQAAELFEQALRLAPDASGVAPALEGLFYGAQRWDSLSALLLAEAQRRVDPAIKALLLAEAARIQSDLLAERAPAAKLLEEAYALTPSDSAILHQLELVYERGRDYVGLCQTLVRQVEHSDSDTETVALLHRIGVIQREHLDDRDAALSNHQRALALDPGFRPAIDAAMEILRERGAFEDVLSMVLADAKVFGDTAHRVAAYVSAANICEKELGRPGEAERCYRQALELDPRHRPAFSALARLLQERKDWRSLVELYERGVEATEDTGEKVSYLMKIGILQEEAGQRPADAVPTYRRALELAPKRLEAIRALQRAAERVGQWQDACDAVELELAISPDKVVQASLLHSMGQIQEHRLASDEAALECYHRASKLVPAYQPVLASLGELYQRHGRWEDLASVYLQQLTLATTPETKAALCCDLGSLYEERIGKPDEALRHYRRALLSDAHLEVAYRALIRILEDAGDWEEVTKVLEQQLEATQDSQQRAQVALRLAEVFEYRLRSRPRALKAYDQCLAADPQLAAAMRGKERILEQGSEPGKLLSQLEKIAESSPEVHQKVSALFRAGQIARDQMSDTRTAAKSFEAVRQLVARDTGSLWALEVLHAELGNWTELATVLEAAANASHVVPLQIASWRTLATVLEARRSGGDAQLEHAIDRLLKLAPDDTEALAARERLAVAAQDAQAIARIDEKLGSASGDPVVASAHRTRLAEALEAANDSSALELYRSALALDGENLAAARGITRLAQRSESPELLQQAAKNETEVLKDDAMAVELLRHAAEILRASNMAERAADALEDALRLAPGDSTIRKSLTELLSSLAQYPRLAERLSAAAAAAKLPKDRAELWVTVANIQANMLEDSGAALASLGRAIALDAHMPDALFLQAELHSRAGLWPKAAESFRALLAGNPPQDVAVAANFELARLLSEELNQVAGAQSCVNALLQLDPKHKGGLRLAVAVKRALKDYRGARAAAQELAQLATSREERARVLLDNALIERDGGSGDAAAEAFKMALAEAGLAFGVAEAFKEWIGQSAPSARAVLYEVYATALADYVAASAGNSGLDAAYVELAKTYCGPLNLPKRAVSTLKRALTQLPGSLSLKEELAAALHANGQIADAAKAYTEVLCLDPYRVEGWRALSRAYQELDDFQASVGALGALSALGAATPEEQGRLVPAVAPSGSEKLTPELPRLLATTSEEAGASALAAALVPGLYRLLPAELSSYRVGGRDRLGARSAHPLRLLADRVAQMLGAPEFDLYVHSGAPSRVTLELTETPSIMVPEAQSQLDEVSLVFLLARPLASLALNLQVAERADAQTLRNVFAGAVYGVDKKAARDMQAQGDLAAESKRVYKAMPWGKRRPLEEAARQFRDEKSDVLEWAHHARLSALRAALVLAPDLEKAMTLLRASDGDLSSETTEHSARLIGEALAFALSDAARAARKGAGLE